MCHETSGIPNSDMIFNKQRHTVMNSMRLNITITSFCWILFMVNYTAATESCDEADLVQKIAEWANTLPVLVKQDEKRLKNFREFEPITDNPSLLRNEYYRMVSETQQTACNIIKRIGGRWLKECGFLDGEKIVCMDNLHEAVKTDTCLIYSFGLGDDWDFELKMAKLGCVVRAFDPNVEMPKKIQRCEKFTL